jgi:hypothetical protein
LEVKIKSECITSCIGGDPFYVAKSVITEMWELCQKVNLFQQNHMTFGIFWLVLRCDIN